jgi:RHS repeat-associated protein
LSVTGPGGVTTSQTYDAQGRLRTTTDDEGYTLTFDYDALDRPTRTTYPDGTYEETQYERLDATRRRDRTGRWTHTLYDALRRPVSTQDPEGRVVTQQWCPTGCGSLDKIIDANGNATAWERDLLGRVVREVRANGSAKETTYEATTGRVKMVKDAKNQEIHYTYSPGGELLATAYVNAVLPTPNVTMSYVDPVTGTLDPYGRVRQMLDGTGTTTYTYHSVGVLGAQQLASVDGPLANDTITYGYDELGRVVSRTLNGVTSTWSYDQQGRLTSQTDPIGTFTYAYQGDTGRAVTVTYPNSQTTSYAYYPTNQEHRLQEIHHKKPSGASLSKFNYTYDSVGNILTWVQQTETNPAQTYTFEYDRVDQLTAATLAATTPKRYRYVYDPAGNRTVEQVDDAATLSTHDNMNRLITQVPGGGLVFRGTVNEPATVTVGATPATVSLANQFTGTADVPQGTSQVTVQATDPSGNVRTNVYEVTQTGVTKIFTYDSNGNLTSDGTKTYEWDAENRLTAVKEGANTLASFTYDGKGRRATKTAGGVTTSYVYEGAQFLEERPSTGTTKRYVYGLGIDRSLAQAVGSATSYFVADHLGSITQVTDSPGTPTVTRRYDPWGNLLQGSVAAGYAYTGREWDPETSLYYYRARYYSPGGGLFISEDPIRFRGGMNFYRYVFGNPIKYTDPSGLEAGRINEGFEGPYPPIEWPRCYPSCCMKKCLEEIMGPLPPMSVVPNSSMYRNTAISNPLGIGLPGSCEEFYGRGNEVWVLHEYYHVLFQWQPGEMTYPSYVAAAVCAGLRNGNMHDNGYERAANDYAKRMAPILRRCLRNCK